MYIVQVRSPGGDWRDVGTYDDWQAAKKAKAKMLAANPNNEYRITQK